MSNDVRALAEAELAQIHSRFQPALASCLPAWQALTAQIEQAAADHNAAAWAVYQRLRPQIESDRPQWHPYTWHTEIRGAVMHQVHCDGFKATDALLDETDRRAKPILAEIEPLFERWAELDGRAYDGDYDGILDGRNVPAKDISRQYRKALRGWILRWREPLRRQMNLDPQFVRGQRFTVDFFTHDPENVDADPDSEAESLVGRLGSALVAREPKNAKRGEVEDGMMFEDGLHVIELPAKDRRRRDRKTAETVPLAVIQKQNPKAVRAVGERLTARQRELLADYFIHHRPAEEIAADYGSTAELVRTMAQRIADEFAVEGLPRPRHEKSVGDSDRKEF